MKSLLESKAGKTSPLIAILVIALIGVGIYFVYTNYLQQSVTTTTTGTVGACPDSTGILTVNSFSASNSGTDPANVNITAGVNGGSVTTSVTSGTTTFPVGSNLEVLVSSGNYLDKKFTTKMACGGTTLDAPIWLSTSDNPSIRIKNDDDNYMTDAVAGGATNQTNLAAGETLNLVVEFQGTSGESSGDGILVIEFGANTNANVSTVTLDGASPVSIPSVHSLVNAASKSVAFEIPAVEEGKKVYKTLSINLAASKDLAGGVLTDWYAKQYFVDDDNTIKYGIQDASGDAKYENTLDYDFYIDGA